jgi:hypothetical protein
MKQLQQRRETDNRAQTSRRREEEANQKKWKVGINKKENRKVENKINITTTSRGGGTFFTVHTYNFIVSFPITPFFLSSPPCFLLQTFGIHPLE